MTKKLISVGRICWHISEVTEFNALNINDITFIDNKNKEIVMDEDLIASFKESNLSNSEFVQLLLYKKKE